MPAAWRLANWEADPGVKLAPPTPPTARDLDPEEDDAGVDAGPEPDVDEADPDAENDDDGAVGPEAATDEADEVVASPPTAEEVVPDEDTFPEWRPSNAELEAEEPVDL